MPLNQRISVYLRVSTEIQSTELQKREIEAFLASKGWTGAIFYEDKLTGTNANRPKLQELLAAARAKQIDTVIVWKLDRFFRSLKDLVTTLHEFNELGVTFISLKDQIDLSTSQGRLMANILGSLAEFEAELIRGRVIAGLANARAKGKILGRRKRRNDEEIVSLRKQGLSIRAIAKTLQIATSSIQQALKCDMNLQLSAVIAQ